MRCLVLLASLHGVCSQLDPLAPWPFTFGDQSRRSQSAYTGPVVGPPVLMWSYALPGGKAYHPPVITSSGAVAFYSFPPNNAIITLNGSTGAWRWTTTVNSNGLVGGNFGVTLSADAAGDLWCAIYQRLAKFNGATGAQTTGGAPNVLSANGGALVSANNTVLVTTASNKILYGCWAPLFPSSACETIIRPIANGNSFILGSPAVSSLDGSIFIQSYSNNWLHKVFTNGTLAWAINTVVYSNSYRNPTVSNDGSAVYAAGSALVYAINATDAYGATLWTYAPPGAPSLIAVSPRATSELLFGDASGVVTCLRPSGALRWAAAVGGAISSSPTVGGDGTVYVASASGWLSALQGDTGALLWRVWTFCSAPCLNQPSIGANGWLYFTSEGSGPVLPAVYAYAPAPSPTGTPSPTPSPSPTLSLGASPSASAAATASATGSPTNSATPTSTGSGTDSRSGTPSRTGCLLCGVNASGGAPQWTQAMAVAARGNSPYVGPRDGVYVLNRDYSTMPANGIYGSPAIGPNGNVYYARRDNEVFIMSPAGAFLDSFYLGGQPTASLELHPSAPYFFAIAATTNTVWARNAAPAFSAIWSSNAHGPGHCIVLLPTNSSVLLSVHESGKVVAWRALTGAVLWVWEPPVATLSFFSCPAFDPSGGSFYITSTGVFRLFRVAVNGTELWNSIASGGGAPALSATGSWSVPTVVPDGSLVIFPASDGFVRAVSPANGAVVWAYRVGGTSLPMFGTLALLSNGTAGLSVIGVSNSGFVFALGAASGALLWTSAIPGSCNSASMPLIDAAGVMYVYHCDTTAAFNASTGGAPFWSVNLVTSGEGAGAPYNNWISLGANGFLYMGSSRSASFRNALWVMMPLPSPTTTPSGTTSPTATLSPGATPSATPTYRSDSPTPTPSLTPTGTGLFATGTPSNSGSDSATSTGTGSPTGSATPSESGTLSPGATPSSSPTHSPTPPSRSGTPTPNVTATGTPSGTLSAGASPSATASATPTAAATGTPTGTPTRSGGASFSASPVPSPSSSPAPALCALAPLAGSGAPGGADGAALTAASVNSTGGLAFSPGRVDGVGAALLFADTGSDRVRRLWLGNGTVGALPLPWALSAPQGVGVAMRPPAPGEDASALTPLAYIVADTGAPALRVAFTNGSAVASFSPGGAALAAPWGIAVEAAAAPASAAQSAFWVSDAAGNRVFLFALLPAPARLATAGSGAAGWADGPGASAAFSSPRGVAVRSGSGVGAAPLLVADFNNHRVRAVGANGSVSTLAGCGVAATYNAVGQAACFDGPLALAVDESGGAFLAEGGGNRIRYIAFPSLAVSTVLGRPSGAPALGVGAAAGLSAPRGLALAIHPLAAGSGFPLFVADSGNAFLRVAACGVAPSPSPAPAPFFCAPGYFCNPRVAPYEPVPCPAGAFCPANATAPTPCGEGTANPSPLAPTAAACAPCTAGSFSPSVGSASCAPCLAGFFSSAAGTSSCTLCAAGTHSPSAGGTSCIPCAPGSYGPSAGLDSCAPCPVGTANAGAGASTPAACGACPEGAFSPAGAAACTPAPGGFFSPAPGLGAPYACPMGTFSPPSGGAVACTPCAPGLGSNPAAGTCIVCPNTAAPVAYNVTTFAGRPSAAGAVDGIGSNARFNIPVGFGAFHITIDAAGRLLVADTFRIRAINTSTAAVTTFAMVPVSPTGVAADYLGNVYYLGGTTLYVSPAALPVPTFSVLVGRGTNGATDGVGTNAQFVAPQCIAVAPNASFLLVCDYSGRMRRIMRDTKSVGTLSGSFNFPMGAAVNAAGNIYIASRASDNIQLQTQAGVISTYSSPLLAPKGLVLDANGTLYAACQNGRVIMAVPRGGGAPVVIAGSGGVAAVPGDGVGTAANFSAPNGITRDHRTGVLYVIDLHSVRALTPVCPPGYVLDLSCGSVCLPPSPTPTTTPSPSPSGTRSGSDTATATGSGSAAVTGTPSPSATPSQSGARSGSSTSSQTPTGSPTRSAPPPPLTPTGSPTPSQSGSPTLQGTRASTPTPSGSGTESATASLTQTPSGTPSPTISASASPTASASATPSLTQTPSGTPTPTKSVSPSPTASATATPSKTPSNTGTGSGTASMGASLSATPSGTPTQSGSGSGSGTSSGTGSGTGTATGSASGSASAASTGSDTPSRSPTGSLTGTLSGTPSTTATGSMSTAVSAPPTPSLTPSASASNTGSISDSPSPTPSSTLSGSATLAGSGTGSATPSGSDTATRSRTPAASGSSSPSPTPSPRASAAGTGAATASASPSPSGSPSGAPSLSATPSPPPPPSAGASATASVTPIGSPPLSSSPTASIPNTLSASPTPTLTAGASASASSTVSATPTASLTPGASASNTGSNSFSASPTASQTGTGSGTGTPTGSPSGTPPPTPSTTASASSTVSATPTASLTSGASASNSGSASFSGSRTASPTASVTPTASATSSGTGTPPPTPSSTVSGSSTISVTPTASLPAGVSPSGTGSASFSASATPSQTPTSSATPTPSGSSTGTPLPTPSTTLSGSSTATASPTSTLPVGATASPTPAASDSGSATPSQSASATPTGTPTASPTGTASATPSPTRTLGASASGTPTPSLTAGASPSNSGSRSLSPSATPSGTGTASPSGTPTASATGTPPPTPTSTASGSSTVTASATPSLTPGASPSATASDTASGSASPTTTAPATPSPTRTGSPTETATPSKTGTPTATLSAAVSPSATPSLPPSGSGSASEPPSLTATASPPPAGLGAESGAASGSLLTVGGGSFFWAAAGVAAAAVAAVVAMRWLVARRRRVAGGVGRGPAGRHSKSPARAPAPAPAKRASRKGFEVLNPLLRGRK